MKMLPDDKCERCSEPHIGCNEDGIFLCEDCMFEELIEQQEPLGEEFAKVLHDNLWELYAR